MAIAHRNADLDFRDLPIEVDVMKRRKSKPKNSANSKLCSNAATRLRTSSRISNPNRSS